MNINNYIKTDIFTFIIWLFMNLILPGPDSESKKICEQTYLDFLIISWVNNLLGKGRIFH